MLAGGLSQRAVVARGRKARPVVRQTAKRAVEQLPETRQWLGIKAVHRRAFGHARSDQPLIEDLIAGGGVFGLLPNPEYVQQSSSHRASAATQREMHSLTVKHRDDTRDIGSVDRFVDHAKTTEWHARRAHNARANPNQ